MFARVQKTALIQLLALLLFATSAIGFGRDAVAEESAAPTRKVVVELFTSQGCIACPPADAYLGELAGRDEIIALGLHVDYWDYLGAPDPFAMPEHSARQNDYLRMLGGQGRGVTPQMVVQGSVGIVGAHRSVVEMAIDQVAAEQGMVDVTLSLEGARLSVSLAPTRASESETINEPFDVVLVGYDGPHSVYVSAGANNGREIIYYNVVRDMERIGSWSGGAATFSAEIDPTRGGYVVLVQQPGPGLIVGSNAAALPVNAAFND